MEDVLLLADVVLLAELEVSEPLPDELLPSPPQAAIKAKHDTAPVIRKYHAFRCFMNESPGCVRRLSDPKRNVQMFVMDRRKNARVHFNATERVATEVHAGNVVRRGMGRYRVRLCEVMASRRRLRAGGVVLVCFWGGWTH